MKRTDLNEAVAVLRSLVAAILAVPCDRTGVQAGLLRQVAGALSTDAETAIASFTFGSQLVSIFGYLRGAGAAFADIDAVRRTSLGVATVSLLAEIIADAVMLQALCCACRIVADSEFTSRDQVDNYRSTLDAGFDAAIDKAADDEDQTSYRALLGLRAATMRDLSARARPLPEIVPYQFPTRRPALWLAQRLYADASRYESLIAENNVVHPLFMPESGHALSR